jgi:hypothetical protein
MRAALVCWFLAACGGPSRSTLADTPAATTPGRPAMAPPASGDDKERSQLNQQFEDMHDAKEARREASHDGAAPPPGAGSGSAGPVKHGPAEQAPDRVKPVPAPSK